MKTINNFINEKLKISSKSNINIYTCQPKDKVELREILEKRLIQDENADLNDIDVSQITDMGNIGLPRNKGLFEDLDTHNIDISKWDVSNVTDMANMFRCCKKFTGKGLENWDVFNVTDMSTMFAGCDNFNADLSKWDVSKVKYMDFMFFNCYKFTGKGLEKWDVSNVENMRWMFEYCNSLKNIPSWYNDENNK